jgi:transcriptional regulator with XRE-family HTH domain
MEEFGSYLRRLREERGLSRPQLRDRLVERWGSDRSLSTAQLGNWEAGETEGISAPMLARLVVVLEADYDEVFSRLW